MESYVTFTARVNSMCLVKLQREIEKGEELVARQRNSRTEPEAFYKVFVNKVAQCTLNQLISVMHFSFHSLSAEFGRGARDDAEL